MVAYSLRISREGAPAWSWRESYILHIHRHKTPSQYPASDAKRREIHSAISLLLKFSPRKEVLTDPENKDARCQGLREVSAGIRGKKQKNRKTKKPTHVKHKNHQAPQTLGWRQIFQTILLVSFYPHSLSHLLPGHFLPTLPQPSSPNPC